MTIFFLCYKLTLTVLWSIDLIVPDLKMWSISISKAKLNIVIDQQAEEAEGQGDTTEAVQKHVSKS